MLTTTGAILTLIVQQFFNNRSAIQRAKEHRAQTLADTDLARAETAKLAAALAIEVQKRADLLRAAMEEACRACELGRNEMAIRLDRNAAQIAENTALTIEAKTAAHAAFTEANSVNQKLVNIGVEMRDGSELGRHEPKT